MTLEKILRKEKGDEYLLSTYYIPATVLGTLHMLSLLILRKFTGPKSLLSFY